MAAEGQRRSERLGLALLAGLTAAIAGAIAWGLFEYSVNHVYELLTVPMGLVVGLSVARTSRPGLRCAATSAVLAVAGCALGPFLLTVFFALGHSHVTLAFLVGHPNDLSTRYPHAVGTVGFLTWPVAAFLAFMIPLDPRRRPSSATAGGS
jgi:hypothetical protein